MNLSREPDTNELATFFPFKEAPNYAKARELAPLATVIARTFGGYAAFYSMNAYHAWMATR